jgi:2-polyprenyl-3-methyl-5-hydroxy-6-metoxy-1,4-benzoquinol methylase
MPEQTHMHDHFTRIAGNYRGVRTTDAAPIEYIRDALAARGKIVAADIGCGAGRYDLSLFRYLDNLHLTCVDANPAMLERLSALLEGEGIEDFETIASTIETLGLADRSLDCVTTFNAIHHFHFPTFLAKAGAAIREDGRIFIYTRTPEHNAGSVWGRYFPGFNEKETRLHTARRMEDWIRGSGGLRLIDSRTFSYDRTAPLERLLSQATSQHYSTFSLYDEAEFEAAIGAFEDNVRRHYDDPRRIDWVDRNLMLQVGF